MNLSNLDRVRQRVEFCLTYDRTQPRRFSIAEIDGPNIPCAYTEGNFGPGVWEGDETTAPELESATEDELIDHFAVMAVTEAIHEALEWFRVDGKPWIDPHGRRMAKLYSRIDDFTAELVKLRH